MNESVSARRDPAARVAEAYERIWHTRMEGLPFLNPALRVEAVGFREWQGEWLGALVTPWSLNLVLLPGEGKWPSLAPGAERFVAFPAGTFRFIAGHEASLGESHSCSLFSPVLEFADHDAACLTAEAALAALFVDEEPMTPPVSKRDFLRGRFSGMPNGDRG